jgi:hypothetical protein
MQATIASNAARLRHLHDRIDTTFREQPHGPEHRAACDEFHREYDSLAFPGGLAAGLKQLKNNNPEVIEAALQFMVEDPRFFRSGYIKEEILRRLKHCDLSNQQQSRIAMLIVRSMDGGGRREFEGYSRLARRIHPPSLIAAAQTRLSSRNLEIVRRAKAVLHVLKSNHLLPMQQGDPS